MVRIGIRIKTSRIRNTGMDTSPGVPVDCIKTTDFSLLYLVNGSMRCTMHILVFPFYLYRFSRNVLVLNSLNPDTDLSFFTSQIGRIVRYS
jgi:hypothetical protein